MKSKLVTLSLLTQAMLACFFILIPIKLACEVKQNGFQRTN